MYIWKVGTSEHWRKHRDSRLAKTRTHCCELAEEQWLEVSMAGTSSSAYRPIEAHGRGGHFDFSSENGWLCCAVVFFLCRCPLLALAPHPDRNVCHRRSCFVPLSQQGCPVVGIGPSPAKLHAAVRTESSGSPEQVRVLPINHGRTPGCSRLKKAMGAGSDTLPVPKLFAQGT